VSLRARIALIASAAVTVAVLAMAVTVYIAVQDRLIREVDRSLTDRASASRGFGAIADAFGGRRRGPFQGARGFDVLYVQVTDETGNVFVPDGQDLRLPEFVGEHRPDGRAVLREATVDGVHLRIAGVPLPNGLGVLQLGRSLEEVDATLSALALALTLVGLIGVVAAAVIGLLVARSSLRPLENLTEAAEHVAETKQLEARIEVDRKDEVGRLAGAFNEMMEALERSKSQQRQLVRDAGHELRTPLTALRTNIELLGRAPDLPSDERLSIHEDLRVELEELTKLVNEVVAVAADPDVTEPMAVVDLGELVEHVVARYRRRVTQTISVDLVDAGPVAARVGGIERAVGNLIENAAKWSPPESTVTVTVAGGLVTVADEGPGISAEDRDRVFDRFYRAEEARRKPGSGLGLAIVKQVAEAHGGRVFVESVASGAKVGLEFPLADLASFSDDS